MQLQLQLHCYNYTTLHHTTLLQYTRLDYTTLHLTTLNYIALRYITLHRPTLTTTTTTLLHSTLHLNHTTPHFPTLHYTTFITPPQIQLQLHYANFTNYTTTTIHNSTRLQLLLQLRYTTLHPAVVGEVTIATIATTPKDTTRTTFGSISEFALQSMHDSNQPLPPLPFAVILVLLTARISWRVPLGLHAEPCSCSVELHIVMRGTSHGIGWDRFESRSCFGIKCGVRLFQVQDRSRKRRLFLDFQRKQSIAATCNRLLMQPLSVCKWPPVAAWASGCKWLQAVAGAAARSHLVNFAPL